MRTRPRFKIRIKILFALLWLSVLSLVLFAYITLKGMKGLGQYAIESSVSLGDKAVDDAITALQTQAEGYLLRLAGDQAELSSVLLEQVESEVSIAAEYASELWKNLTGSENVWFHSQEQVPEGIFAASGCDLAPGVSAEDVKSEVSLSANMDKIFSPVLKNDPNLDMIGMGTESGIFRSCPWRDSRDISYDPRKRAWYKKAAEAGSITWTELYIDAATKELIITCAKPFYHSGGELAGVVEADVTLKVLNDRIMSTRVGQSGYAFLLDKHGKVIARPGLSPGDTRWDETYNTGNLLQSDNEALKAVITRMTAGETGITRVILDGGEKYLAYAPIDGTSWSLGIVLPVGEIVAPALATREKIMDATGIASRQINLRIGTARNKIFTVCVFVTLLVFLVAYRLARRITRPILTLRDGVRVVGGGDLNHQLKVNTRDEIEDLANSFNKMTGSLKSYIKELTETTAEKERMEEDLKIAHDIQMSIVPKIFPPFPDRDEFGIYAVLRPAKEVGGDFYDFFFRNDDVLCFIIGDVSGKGVPASLFMAVTITLIKKIAREASDPAEVLDKVNRELARDNDNVMFVTIFCGFLNVRTGEVTYCNGGHNPPLLAGEGETLKFVEGSDGTVVGMLEEVVYKSERMTMDPGDTLYMYTDGVTEAFNLKREQFSEERMKESVTAHKNEPIKELVENTLQEVRNFSHDVPQSDDITIVALRYKGQV